MAVCNYLSDVGYLVPIFIGFTSTKLKSNLLSNSMECLFKKLIVVQMVKKLKGSLTCSEKSATGPHPEPF
jgi:hypothetical protein